jgi:hypothetical protein
VWGRRISRRDRTVDVFVRKLRDKIESHGARHTFIQTRYGVGYTLEAMRLGVRELDSELPQDLHYLRMDPLRGPGPCRASLVPSGLHAEERLGDLRASRVLDAHEEDVRYFGTASSL